MSPLGIKRFVAILLILSPWIFIPGIFKEVVFVLAGILLFISTLDLRRRSARSADHQETESMPRSASGAAPREAYSQSGETSPRKEELHPHSEGAPSANSSVSA